MACTGEGNNYIPTIIVLIKMENLSLETAAANSFTIGGSLDTNFKLRESN